MKRIKNEGKYQPGGKRRAFLLGFGKEDLASKERGIYNRLTEKQDSAPGLMN